MSSRGAPNAAGEQLLSPATLPAGQQLASVPILTQDSQRFGSVQLLRFAIARQAAEPREHLVDVAHRLFGPEHGIDLDLPSRGSAPARPPPDFSGPEYGE